MTYIQRIVTRANFAVFFNGSIYELGLEQFEANVLIVSLLILLLTDLVRYRRGQRLDVFLQEQNLWFRWLVCVILFVMVWVYGVYGPVYDASQFIYFQF